MAIARWAALNWHDLSWYPLWFNGMPFHQVYQPGLHVSVAALATILHISVPVAYHTLTAITYSLSAVSLYFLCLRATRNSLLAMSAASFYSLVSASCLLVPLVRQDAGGWLAARRYQVLVQYGEGPHTTAVMLIPLIIWLVHRTVERDRLATVTLPFVLAITVLTNWPGSIGLSLAIIAYLLSRLDSLHLRSWISLFVAAIAAYLIANPWVPPSVISLVLTNARQAGGTAFGTGQQQPLLITGGILAVLTALFMKLRIDPWLRFFAYFSMITGAVSMGTVWFGWSLLPQPGRFQVEFDVAFAGLLAYGIAALAKLLPIPAKRIFATILLGVALLQGWNVAAQAKALTRPIDMTQTIEYRMADQFEKLFKDQRVFAPGNVALWMNLFNDVPQFSGCCDQGIPDFEYRIATFVIYSGMNAGDRDAEISLKWLRAYGVNGIGVVGPNSTEPYKPFAHWNKFEGMLPEIWRDGDNIIYRIPRKSTALAAVIPRSAIPAHAPVNGLDVEPLEPLISAFEDLAIPAASFRWLNRHEAVIDADADANQVVHLQLNFDRDWHAFDGDGRQLPIARDPLGMMYVQPNKPGPLHLRLVYQGGPWYGPIGQWFFVALGIGTACLASGIPRSYTRRLAGTRI